MLATPLVLVNFKLYPQATGANAVKLAKAVEAGAKGFRGVVAVVPQAVDLRAVVAAVRLPVLAQHIDPVPSGKGTGWTLAEAVKDAGAVGSLINHAERRLEGPLVRACVERLRGLGMVGVVCAEDNEVAARLAPFRPDFLAVEPPELIGGDLSVTQADPEVVRRSVAAVKSVSPSTKVLCGAGVKTGADYHAALSLGTDGVLLATGIVLAKDPAKALADLVR